MSIVRGNQKHSWFSRAERVPSLPFRVAFFLSKKLRQPAFDRVVVHLSVLLVCLATAGCQTPNVRPFHDATLGLYSAVRQAHNTTWARLDVYEAADSNGNRLARSDTNHPANRFSTGWVKRLQVMEAMVSYSESLANIVNSGEESRANAKAISDQAARLVEATPWGVYGAAASDIFQKAHGLAVSVAQYRSIAKAVGKADELVQKVAEAVGKDLESLEKILAALHDDQLMSIGGKYNHHRAYVNAVRAQRLDLEVELLKRRNAADGLRLALLESRAPLASNLTAEQRLAAQQKIVQARNKLDDALTDQKLVEETLRECDELLARVGDTESSYQNEVKTQQEVRQASSELVKATGEAVRQWASAHKDLKAAIEENRTPNVTLLVSSVSEIRETIRQLKSHE
jgi:hypothetical protein